MHAWDVRERLEKRGGDLRGQDEVVEEPGDLVERHLPIEVRRLRAEDLLLPPVNVLDKAEGVEGSFASSA